MPLEGTRCEAMGYISPVVLVVPNAATKGKMATYALLSNGSPITNSFQNGCIFLVLLGAQMWKKWLHHPSRLEGAETEDRVKSGYINRILLGPRVGTSG